MHMRLRSSSNPYPHPNPTLHVIRVCPETITRTIARTMSQAFVKRCGSSSSPEGDAALVTSLKVTEAQAQDLVAQIEHPYRRRVCRYTQHALARVPIHTAYVHQRVHVRVRVRVRVHVHCMHTALALHVQEAVQLLLRVMEPAGRAGWQARSAADFLLGGGLAAHAAYPAEADSPLNSMPIHPL